MERHDEAWRLKRWREAEGRWWREAAAAARGLGFCARSPREWGMVSGCAGEETRTGSGGSKIGPSTAQSN